MRCLFCKTETCGSKTAEHIIPESLGNVQHVLPPGWVCSACNNYLAREVEKPFLETAYARSCRFNMAVPSKRDRIPSVVGLHPQSRTKVELFHSDDDGLSVGAAPGEDESRWVASLLSYKRGSLYIPAPDVPDCDSVTSRFIGKIGLEILAHRLRDVTGWNDELVDKIQLDELRRYVRMGFPKIVWPVSVRRIYPSDFAFTERGEPSYETLHEFSVLITPANEYYAVVAIFGVEYAINLGGPELDGFGEWLKRNENRSPLYP